MADPWAKIFKGWNDISFLEEDTAPLERIPCGIPSLDVAVGGGMPVGRTVELYGLESSGKSTVAIHLARQVQRRGGFSVYHDAEFALDTPRLKQLKMTTEHFALSHPACIEEAFARIHETAAPLRALAGTAPLLYAIDSIAALPSKGERDSVGGMAPQARAMSAEMRKITSVISQNRAILVCVNQAREKVGVMFGDPLTTPGGKALKFYSSIRLAVASIQQLKGKDVRGFGIKAHAEENVGFIAIFKVVKNKTASPFKTTYGYLLYESGFDPYLSMFETLRRLDLAKSAGKNWKVRGVDVTFEKRDAVAFVKENLKALKRLLRSRFFKKGVEDGEPVRTSDSTTAAPTASEE